MGNNIYVFTVNGLGGCGKSTFIKLCQRHVKKYNSLAFELSVVDYVKEVAKFCGWEGQKEQKDRIFLSDLKLALQHWNDIPIKKVFESIDQIKKNLEVCDNLIFFINAREEYDTELIRKKCKEEGYIFQSILVENPNKENNEVPFIVDEIKKIHYDCTILNDKTIGVLDDTAKLFCWKHLRKKNNLNEI